MLTLSFFDIPLAINDLAWMLLAVLSVFPGPHISVWRFLFQQSKCGRLVLGHCPRLKEVEGVRQQEEQEDNRNEKERDEVNGEVEETRSNAHNAHETCACVK